MPATPEEINDAMADDAAEGIAEAESDGQKAKLMSADDRIKLADRAAAASVVTGGDAWGSVGRRRAMPNWNE